jgi:hypothetical protein
LVAAVYGFAEANTINGGTAMYLGEGSGTISGYAVTNIEYGLSAANPHIITEVKFDTDVAASTVYVAFDGGNWSAACTDGGGGTSWTCTVAGGGVDVELASTLDVFASDQTIYTP